MPSHKMPILSQCLGLSCEHIDFQNADVPLHKDAVAHYRALVDAAHKQGFGLRAVSGFRDFSRQVLIWNEKTLGRRPVLDREGHALSISQLSERELVFSIMHWSALPGASRHHWGSDFDIYDANALSGDGLQLTVAETQAGGPFFEMYAWLDDYLAQNRDVFVRPYLLDRGGVACEPWHISCEPVAGGYAQAFDAGALRDTIANSELVLKHTVLANFDEIVERFVLI